MPGLSYLSRVQESMAKHQNPVPKLHSITSTGTSVADTVFMERVKLRIEQWRNACRNSNASEGRCSSSHANFFGCTGVE